MQVQAQWIDLLAVAPLIPMLITGLYLFSWPYLNANRAGKRI